jgi:hypothetical protein
VRQSVLTEFQEELILKKSAFFALVAIASRTHPPFSVNDKIPCLSHGLSTLCAAGIDALP